MRRIPLRSRPTLALLTLATIGASPLAAQTRMLRSPTVSEKHIAFAYANNVWVVDRAGGAARRLTSFQGETQNPKLSPDGKLDRVQRRVRRQHRRLRRATTRPPRPRRAASRSA